MEYILPKNLIKKVKKFPQGVGYEDFTVLFKELLNKYRIPFSDPEDINGYKVATVKFDSDLNKLLVLSDAIEHTYIPFTSLTVNIADLNLDKVDNTPDASKNVLSATKLTTPRNINGILFDGTTDIIIADSTKEPSFAKNTAFNKNFGTQAGQVAQGNHTHKFSDITNKPNTLSGYGITNGQETLISGTNIKTVNSQSLLGNGDIEINSLPIQTGKNDKFLKTDGTVTSWESISYTELTGKPTIPTKTSDIVNDSGFLTSHQDISNKETISNKKTDLLANSDIFYPTQKAVKTAVDAKEDSITLGTLNDYYRGDKSWQILDKNAVGLNNVDNVQQQPIIKTGITSTTAATTTKIVTLDAPWDTYTPMAGDMFRVVYTLGTTVTGALLNINNSGAKAVRIQNTTANDLSHVTSANGGLFYYFDGSFYHLWGSQQQIDQNTLYSGIAASPTVSTATTTLVVDRMYIANSASELVFNLPDTAVVGALIIIQGYGAGGFRVNAAAGNNILIENYNTGAAGYLTGTKEAALYLRCTLANTTWSVENYVGVITDNSNNQYGNTLKQDILVSGTNIKTIDGVSILGNGNISTSEIPNQGGNSGKFLTTDGSNISWGTPAGGGGGTMDNFTISGDSGTDRIISNGDTLFFTGGTGIETTIETAVDEVTISLNSTVQTLLEKANTALQAGDNISLLTNNSGYLTTHQDISGKEDKSNKVITFSSPTDAQYPSAKLVKDSLDAKANTSAIPTKVSDLTNDSGFLTSHQDISNKEDKSNKVITFSSPTDAQYPSAKLVKDSLDAKANTSAIPTKTSDIVNDSGFLTSHQDISGKEDKSNKVITFSSPTDAQYPSAKLVNDQLTAKQATIIGAATTITSSNLINDRALISNGSGKVDVSTVTATELGFVSGVTSSVQTQLNSKQTSLGFTPENVTNKKTTLTDNSDTYYPTQKTVKTAVDAKQDTLVSGTNIKSINGTSILGSGNLAVDGLPTQAGKNGKYLKTDGSNATWEDVVSGSDEVYVGSSTPTGDEIVWIDTTGVADTLGSYINALAADKQMSSSDTWYDAASITLPIGKFLINAQLTAMRTATGALTYFARLTDKTTHYASSQAYMPSVSGNSVNIFLTAVVTLASATTIYLQGAASAGAANILIKAALSSNGSGSNATQMTVIKL